MVVHICCSVDSHYFLSELRKEYPQEGFIGFFYNPNIHPKSEYDLRLSDVRRSCDMLKIPLIEGEYELEDWLDSVRGQEDEPEKGGRCSTCFDLRLEKTAQIAKRLGESTFTSTLLSSPMKEQEILYQQGECIAAGFGLEFVKINVRKNGGVQRQNELAKRENLYRQNYCGCQFALAKQREKQNRLSLEMLSELGARALPGSIEERAQSFTLRNELESKGQGYLLTQRKLHVWRLLWGRTFCNDAVVHSYILARSESRRTKSSAISWVYVSLESLLDSHHISTRATCATRESLGAVSHIALQGAEAMRAVRVGLSTRDDVMFLCLREFNALVNAHYERVLDLLYNPVAYELELAIRALLCGSESVNPIVIIDEESQNLAIDIQAVFQEERLFKSIPLLEKLAK